MFSLAFLTQVDVLAGEGFMAMAVLGPILLLLLFFIVFVAKRYKRCPSNKVLVIYGKVGANQAARCLQGGGKFVLPLIQDHAFLNLEPMVIDIPLEGPVADGQGEEDEHGGEGPAYDSGRRFHLASSPPRW